MTLLVDDRLDDGLNGAAFVARGALGMPSGVAGPNYVVPGYIGGAAVTFNTGTATLQVLEITSTSSTTKYADVVLKLSATCTATANVLTCRGTSDVARIGFTSANVMRLFNGSGTSLATGATALPVGSYFRLSLSVVGNTATAKLYTDPTSNTATETLTGTVTGAAMTTNRVGNLSPANINGGTMIVDWPQVSNDAAPVARDTTLSGSGSVSPTAVAPSGTITVTLVAAGGTGSYLYEILNWGDGSTSAQQSSPTFTKTFSGAAAGSKNISARITG